jgi:enoyl-CoA hydratase
MMTAARIARISFLLCLADTLDRAQIRRTPPGLPASGKRQRTSERCDLARLAGVSGKAHGWGRSLDNAIIECAKMFDLSEQGEVTILRMAHGKANAMSIEFCAGLYQRLEEFRTSAARALVLTGTGGIFSAGVDLLRLSEGGAPYTRQFLPVLNAMFAAAFACDRPIVAAVNGHAIAGGCVLACATDKRLMAREQGRIGVTELLVGVPFPPIAMEIMRHAVAPHRFDDTIFSGATFAPDDAVARGLIDEVVDPEVLIKRAVVAAQALAALSPKAFALTKRQARAAALERVKREAHSVDAEVAELWCADETLARVRDYVARTLKKA